MQIEIDLKRNDCHFDQCRNYEDGKCLNDEDRKGCVEIAMAVLCINAEELKK